ncbi:hypothetical protein NUU61_009807 [Penicillium alfredii]|uniref:Uncharacterized protein n=1 Tax=Penicillium alfredii TaxID=1506179 RepID=A0A9W9EGT3_9EURO|nr:uncharacterized protein NUU61_009807 [Penicillium alfredii]KAJ5081543.1 hypothetical protein NUU61_009807 [Penicillium alfredii]
MVQGKTRVFSIAATNPLTKKINTYAYAFINYETRESYRILFERIFKVLGDAGRKEVRWAYQNHYSDTAEGIRTVTVDMCKKQAPGLGDYLAGLDPRWTWSEHLQHVLIFCQTHVKRAFRKKFGDHPATAIINYIWEADSKQAVLSLMEAMISQFPETESWVKNKQVDWILSSITPEASKIPIHWWIQAPHHTGICESSHFVDNEAVGRKQALLTAILRTKGHVHEMFQKNQFETQHGIDFTWRSNDIVTRIAKQNHRKDKRRRAAALRRERNPAQARDVTNPYENDEEYSRIANTKHTSCTKYKSTIFTSKS